MTARSHDRPPRRAVLFFPANRPERFNKAVATGADCICIDLEDAVGPVEKEQGRAAALELLETREPLAAELIVRVNDTKTDLGAADLEALLSCSRPPDAVMLPMVDGPEEVRAVETALLARHPGVVLIALIETARGLERAGDIARSCSTLSALLLGGVDLSSELGCAMEWDALLYARSRVVHAAALGRIDAIDAPSLNVSDVAAVGAEARASARLGFHGKAVIHPAQVPLVQAAFAPDADAVSHARAVVAAYTASNGDAVILDGHVIERPVLKAAQRTLALHGELEARKQNMLEARQRNVLEARQPNTRNRRA